VTRESLRDPPAARLSGWLSRQSVAPRVAIIAGSGMSEITRDAEVLARVPFADLLGMSVPTVAGHPVEVVLATVSGVPCVFILGRLHLYQGLSAWETVATVRSLAGSAVKTLVVLNAAGGLNPSFQVGDLMLITDHINFPGLAGISPFIPPPAGGISFLPMRGAYDAELQDLFISAAAGAGVGLHRGVYAMVAGPNYETDAELAMLWTLGADAVGMSTVHEVLMARWQGLRVAGLSVITNRAIPGETAVPSHDEVLRAGALAIDSLSRLLALFLRGMRESGTG
jgi:purine-nucleoside phosphorylase